MHAATYTYTPKAQITTNIAPGVPALVTIVFGAFPLPPLTITLTAEELTDLLAELEVALHALNR